MSRCLKLKPVESALPLELSQTASRSVCTFQNMDSQRTGVKKDSATKRARAFNCASLASGSTSVVEARTNSFISEISLSTSSMNCIMKSTSLCLSISWVWKFVMRNEMSNP